MGNPDRINRAERAKRRFQQLQELDSSSLFGKESPLLEAILDRNVGEVTRLLDEGADVNEAGQFGSTPLLDAVQYAGASEELRGLQSRLNDLGKGIADSAKEPAKLADVMDTIKSFKPSASSIRQSMREGAERRRKAADDTANSPKVVDPESLELISLLIARGADLDASHFEGHTALYSAASSGTVQVAELLLDAGARIEGADEHGKTPLMVAAEECQPDMVRFLLNRGANVHARTRRQFTPLMAAASGGSKRAVSILIDAGAEVNDHAEDGTTALLAAAIRGYDDVAAQLRERGAEVGLLEALVFGDQAEVDRLAKEEATRAHTPIWGRTVMLWAARVSRPDVIRFLHGLGASVNVEDVRGNSAVFAAGMHGDAETLQALLECGAGTAGPQRKHGFSPLRWACSMGDVERVRLLIAAGADVHEKTSDGETPLISAVMGGQTEIVREMLKAGADPNDCGYALSPLAFASARGDTEIFRLLVEHGAEVNPPRSSDRTRHSFPVTLMPGVKENPEMMSIVRNATGEDLFDAAKAGDYEAVVSLLELGRDPNSRHSGDVTPLHAAAEGGHLRTIELLLDRGADIGSTNIAGMTPFHTAVQCGKLETAQLLAERGAHLNQRTNRGMSPLLIAAVGKHESSPALVAWLLGAGARVGLHEASALGDIGTVRILLDLGRDANESADGLTPLIAAATTDQAAVIDLLLARGAAVDCRDDDGRTALTAAFSRGNEASARLLLEAGADINGAAQSHLDPELGQDFNIHWTPLQGALISGKRELVELALDRGADLEGRGLMGQTAMHAAAYLPDDRLDLLDLLVERGAEVNAANWDGGTPLFTAALAGKTAAVQRLLCHGADPNLKNKIGQSALQYARMGSNNEEAIRLLEAAAQPSQT